MRAIAMPVGAAGAMLLLAACQPIEVQHSVEGPIHMIVDVNLRVDRRLDEFFDFEEDVAPPATQPATAAAAATQPATRPAVTSGT